MDNLSPSARSAQMSLVRSKNTKPELIVRRLAHSLGYRYRLHQSGLPGRPDMVFASRRKVVFVHGCFWHKHDGCAKNRLPKSRVEFWESKLDANVARDAKNVRSLRKLGWKVLIVWECQVSRTERLTVRLRRFLG
ncbi:MAG: very short patch repair endonuclease [Planctomycetia bacterium]